MTGGRNPRRLALGAAGGGLALLLMGGHIAAQQAPLSGGQRFGGQELVGGGLEEGAIQLLEGPRGSVLRISERRGDERKGGGRVLLAELGPQDAWKPLLEIAPPGAGANALNASLGVSPSGQLAVAYRFRQHEPRLKQIRLARSDDGGKTWLDPATPVDTSGQAFESQVAWGKDRTLVVVWDDERRGQRSFDVYSRRSTDGGATWEPEQHVSRFERQLPSDLYARPRLVSDGGDRFWLAFVGSRSAASSVYLSRSVDGGKTWTEALSISGQTRSVFSHGIRRAGERMLATWLDFTDLGDRVFASASSDGGATWSPPAMVQHPPAGLRMQSGAPAALLSADGEALVAWQDTRNGRFDVFVARSTDGGRTWGAQDVRMDADEAGTAHSRFPRLARAADGRVALLWEDDREGWEGIYLRIRAATEARDWGPEQRVTAPPGPKLGARLPQGLWTSSDRMVLAWETWDYSQGAARISRTVSGKTLAIDGLKRK